MAASADISQVFGPYVLFRKLAQGGMAEIFLAKQVGAEGFERNVVIKRMLPALAANPEFVQMFLDEARLAARLSHPNIVQITDLGQQDGGYYICMEYLAGEDFSFLLRQARTQRTFVPLGIVCRIVADAARGLHHAHEFRDEAGRPLNIVHRDVSPGNLFVTYTGQVKVLDFGVAKAESRITHTAAGMVKGKYQYMAPEQARGRADRRSDVFSLGVTLYEATTGRRPFARDTDLAILNAILAGEYTPPEWIRPELPTDLQGIIKRTLKVNADQRYQTAEDLAVELERFCAAQPGGTSSASVASYLRDTVPEERTQSKTRLPSLTNLPAAKLTSKPSSPAPAALRGRRLPWAWALAALVALMAAGGWLLWAKPQAPSAPLSPSTPPVVSPAKAPAPPPEVAPAPIEPPPAEPQPAPPPPKPPAQLTVPVIQRVVQRQSATIARCFEKHREGLPASKGQMQVTFTIHRSGKVSRATSDAPGTPVGRCLEAQVKALRFPAHRDSEVTLTLPFSYEVK